MKNLILPFLLLFFVSCSTNYKTYTKSVASYFDTNEKTIDFLQITDDLTTPICEKLNQETILYISDYVNEKDLKNRSQLGFLLSNQTKVNVLDDSCSQKIQIQDLQLAKSLKIGVNGSRILTRDIKDIKNTNLQDDKQMLVGSYLFTNNQIFFFLKLIDLSTGNIISNTSTSRLINDEFKSLEGIKTNTELTKENQQTIYRPMHL
jgi:PBP1b-binding outer membrane lipoprotein LpoB